MFGSRSARVLLLTALLAVGAFVIAPQAAAAASADVAVLNSVNDSTPNVGDTVTFLVTVVDGGPNDATNVSVSNVLPSGLMFSHVLLSQGTYTFASGQWAVGTVAAGADATLRLSAVVVSPTTQVDTATATADQPDPNPGNNSASATETPQQADLAITQTVDHPTPQAGDVVTFTVTLTDKGPDPATNVTVNDLLPSGLSFISSTPSQGFYSSGSGVWTVGTVTTSTPQTLTIQAVYNGPGRKVNTATVSHSDQFDPVVANNSSSLTVPRTPTQTTVGSSANPSPASQPVTFTATVAPAPDGGTVTFTVDGAPLGAPVAVNTASGTATSSVDASLASGSHHVVATYSGDANYLSSASSALAEVVNAPPPPPTAVISGLRISPSKFVAGAKVSYTLNEPATVRFTVSRCGRSAKRKIHACSRPMPVRGSFTVTGGTGANSFHFTGRVHGHKLAPGRYELIATPSAGGHSGQRAVARFRIVAHRG